MVKVDVDPVASYAGGVDGFAATSPEVTGISIADGSAAIDAYTAYVHGDDRGRSGRGIRPHPVREDPLVLRDGLRRVRHDDPREPREGPRDLSSVAAVQSNELRQVAVEDTTTDTATRATATPTPSATATEPDATPGRRPPRGDGSRARRRRPTRAGALADVVLPPTTPAPDADATTFIGADKVWPSLGGRDRAGEGVIVGVIDSGIWPEHPMLADNGISKPAGGPWACEFGVGGDDAFACNDKLIGAYAFLDSYQQSAGPGARRTTASPGSAPRGTPTDTARTPPPRRRAATPSSAEIFGVDRGPVSGVAPGASVIAYRVCGPDGCFSSDSVAAVGQALLDGVDVINFSISGGNSAYTDPVELAFLDAFAGGITVNASAGNDGPGAATAEPRGTVDHDRRPPPHRTGRSRRRSILTSSDGATT